MAWTKPSRQDTSMSRPKTLGELKRTRWAAPGMRQRTVKEEMRANVIRQLHSGNRLFPGIVGYDDTVVPQVVNAVLSRHNLILLGLRGQAKSRILRGLTQFLDEEIPVMAGCEINCNPFRPHCRACRALVEESGDEAPISFLPREARYVEKLATPDVTIADMIGDVDPIRAARSGLDLADELTILAGKVPSDLAGTLFRNPDAVRFLRSIGDEVLSAEEWAKLIAKVSS